MKSTTFPFVTEMEVIFRDIDSMGHVNNAVYLTYIETARIKYFDEIKLHASLNDIDMIVAQATCNYKLPAFLGDTLEIGVAVTRFGNKSFDCTYHINTTNGRLVATATTVQVTYNYQEDRPMRVPAELKDAVLDFQGGLDFPGM
ncbi:MAG: acyl-CoA thioesterase [Anaerolineales bacterium]|jgi:acyl-CoA thioester hydrolase|nr:acyl-CoA thioesterase [Anaerolineales bacterium]